MNLKHFGEISQTTGGDQSTQKFSICPPNALPPENLPLRQIAVAFVATVLAASVAFVILNRLILVFVAF